MGIVKNNIEQYLGSGMNMFFENVLGLFDTIKNEYGFKIYPIIQSCAKVIANFNINRIGVFATTATVNSGVYAKELKKYYPTINDLNKRKTL